VVIHVKDGDDLNPIFSQDVYETKTPEDYPMTVGTVFQSKMVLN
jgi:hypothetical protein